MKPRPGMSSLDKSFVEKQRILTEHELRIELVVFGIFCAPPPSLVGTYYLKPPDARAIFLHNDLLCNGTCSVTRGGGGGGGGGKTYWGGGAQTEKILFLVNFVFQNKVKNTNLNPRTLLH